jgi:hypothetical protein
MLRMLQYPVAASSSIIQVILSDSCGPHNQLSAEAQVHRSMDGYRGRNEFCFARDNSGARPAIDPTLLQMVEDNASHILDNESLNLFPV